MCNRNQLFSGSKVSTRFLCRYRERPYAVSINSSGVAASESTATGQGQVNSSANITCSTYRKAGNILGNIDNVITSNRANHWCRRNKAIDEYRSRYRCTGVACCVSGHNTDRRCGIYGDVTIAVVHGPFTPARGHDRVGHSTPGDRYRASSLGLTAQDHSGVMLCRIDQVVACDGVQRYRRGRDVVNEAGCSLGGGVARDIRHIGRHGDRALRQRFEIYRTELSAPGTARRDRRRLSQGPDVHRHSAPVRTTTGAGNHQRGFVLGIIEIPTGDRRGDSDRRRRGVDDQGSGRVRHRIRRIELVARCIRNGSAARVKGNNRQITAIAAGFDCVSENQRRPPRARRVSRQSTIAQRERGHAASDRDGLCCIQCEANDGSGVQVARSAGDASAAGGYRTDGRRRLVHREHHVLAAHGAVGRRARAVASGIHAYRRQRGRARQCHHRRPRSLRVGHSRAQQRVVRVDHRYRRARLGRAAHRPHQVVRRRI